MKKRISALMGALVLAAVMTGCGGAAGTGNNAQTAVVSNPIFSITMPADAAGTYETETSDHGISVYDKEAKDADCGGHAFTVEAYKEPSEYAGGMDMKIGEFTAEDGTLYDIVIQYPSDVQYDVTKYQDKMPESYERFYRGAEDIVQSLQGADGKGTFAFKAGTKGEDLYGDILAKHIQAVNEGWDANKLEAEDMSPMYYAIAVAEGSADAALSKIGYAYHDCNVDGIDELFIGEIAEGDGKGVTYDIYTMVDRKPAHVVSGTERNRYFALETSMLLNEYSNGAAESGWTLCDIEPNTTNLLNQVKLKVDGYENEEQPYFVSYGDDEEWESLTEEEFEQRKFTDYLRFDFTPLAEAGNK